MRDVPDPSGECNAAAQADNAAGRVRQDEAPLRALR